MDSTCVSTVSSNEDDGDGHKYETRRLFAVAQWLRCCATNRKVAGSIPAGVSGFFVDIKSF